MPLNGRILHHLRLFALNSNFVQIHAGSDYNLLFGCCGLVAACRATKQEFPCWNFRIGSALLQKITKYSKNIILQRVLWQNFCRVYTRRGLTEIRIRCVIWDHWSPLNANERNSKIHRNARFPRSQLNTLRMNGKGINQYRTENSKFKRQIICYKSIQIGLYCRL